MFDVGKHEVECTVSRSKSLRQKHSTLQYRDSPPSTAMQEYSGRGAVALIKD